MSSSPQTQATTPITASVNPVSTKHVQMLWHLFNKSIKAIAFPLGCAGAKGRGTCPTLHVLFTCEWGQCMGRGVRVGSIPIAHCPSHVPCLRNRPFARPVCRQGWCSLNVQKGGGGCNATARRSSTTCTTSSGQERVSSV